jgi:hypothetical protein
MTSNLRLWLHFEKYILLMVKYTFELRYCYFLGKSISGFLIIFKRRNLLYKTIVPIL